MNIRKQNRRVGIPQDLDKLLSFNRVKVNIPRLKLLKLFYKPRPLTKKEYAKIGQKQKEINKAINRLNHASSVVGVVLQKCGHTKEV